jgi:hypothetical protein
VRRLHPHTPVQWMCGHRWKTTTSRPGQGHILRVRYLTCQRCSLKVKTEERLAVPWNKQDFKALVAQVFPENTVVNVATLKVHGLLAEDLSRLNAHLLPHGWQLELVREQGRIVGVVRRRMSPEARGGTNRELNKRRVRRPSKGGC